MSFLNKEQQKQFAERIRAFRYANVLSRTELAREMGCQQMTITYLERGDKSPSVTTIRRYLEVEQRYADEAKKQKRRKLTKKLEGEKLWPSAV